MGTMKMYEAAKHVTESDYVNGDFNDPNSIWLKVNKLIDLHNKLAFQVWELELKLKWLRAKTND